MRIQPTQNNFNRPQNPNFKARIKVSDSLTVESLDIGSLAQGKALDKQGKELFHTFGILWDSLIQFANNYRGDRVIDASNGIENVKLLKNPFTEKLAE